MRSTVELEDRARICDVDIDLMRSPPLTKKIQNILRQSMGRLIVDDEPKYRYNMTPDKVFIKVNGRFRDCDLFFSDGFTPFLFELSQLGQRGDGEREPYVQRVVRAFMADMAWRMGHRERARVQAQIKADEELRGRTPSTNLLLDVLTNYQSDVGYLFHILSNADSPNFHCHSNAGIFT